MGWAPGSILCHLCEYRQTGHCKAMCRPGQPPPSWALPGILCLWEEPGGRATCLFGPLLKENRSSQVPAEAGTFHLLPALCTWETHPTVRHRHLRCPHAAPGPRTCVACRPSLPLRGLTGALWLSHQASCLFPSLVACLPRRAGTGTSEPLVWCSLGSQVCGPSAQVSLPGDTHWMLNWCTS